MVVHHATFYRYQRILNCIQLPAININLIQKANGISRDRRAMSPDGNNCTVEPLLTTTSE